MSDPASRRFEVIVEKMHIAMYIRDKKIGCPACSRGELRGILLVTFKHKERDYHSTAYLEELRRICQIMYVLHRRDFEEGKLSPLDNGHESAAFHTKHSERRTGAGPAGGAIAGLAIIST
jgi:hypothetical protein